jgi:glyoxylase-like metal-dependent hydrolase (beta-lactamase superfamily II)
MRLIATPGHSPGHQSLVLDAPGGPLLLAGQAVYTRGEWLGLPEAMEGAGSAQDAAAYRRSVTRLRALKPTRVLVAHDHIGWPDESD